MLRTLIAALLASLNMPAAWACICIPQTVESKIESAAHVFRARVVGFERTIFTFPGTEMTTDLFYTPEYEVMDVLKGDPAQLDDIYVLPFSCSPHLEPGHDYVFIVRVDPRFDLALTGGCGSTIDLGESPYSTPAWTEFLSKLRIGRDD